MKKVLLAVPVFVGFVLLTLLALGTAAAAEPPSPGVPEPSDIATPSQTSGTGTHFEVTGSDYANCRTSATMGHI